MPLQGIFFRSLQQQHQATDSTRTKISVWVTCGMDVAPGSGLLGPISSLAASCHVTHKSPCALALELTASLLQASRGLSCQLQSASRVDLLIVQHIPHFPLLPGFSFSPTNTT